MKPKVYIETTHDTTRNGTLRGMIVHALHDEAGHQGEIYLLKKLAEAEGVKTK